MDAEFLLWRTLTAQAGGVAQELVWLQTIVFQCFRPSANMEGGGIYDMYCNQPPGGDVFSFTFGKLSCHPFLFYS